MGELLRTVESESRWALGDGLGDTGILRGGGAGLAGRRVFGFDSASAEAFGAGQANLIVQGRFGASSAAGTGVVGFAQANLMVQARLGASSAGGGVVGFAGASTGFFSSFLPPHANIMHLLRPKVASTPCSPAGAVGFGAAMESLSCPTNFSRCSESFIVNGGSMVWIMVEGSGGLGVHVLVPGLVKPSSLVRPAVEMVLLLHVEMHDMPRGGSLSDSASTGELVFEADCNAEVRSDVLRSIPGFEEIFVNDDECWILRGAGRGVRPCSGGSSTSAGTSSSAAMVGGIVLGVDCIVLIPAASVLPM
jgi:hypothetical protein